MTDRNSKPTRDERYDRSIGAAGAFDIDILNTLGRDQKAQRNKLYQFALKNPEKYLDERAKAIDSVVDDQIRKFYVMFKELLRQGSIDGTQVLFFADTARTPYKPMLPDPTIQKMCLAISETLEDVCERCISEVLPIDHKELAVKKMSELNKVGL